MSSININLNSSSTIHDIQYELKRYFPFLRFEFNKIGKQVNENEKPVNLTPSLKIFNVTNLRERISIDFSGDKKLLELKNEFQKIGLTVVIYRKSGNVWVKTSLTEDWSLQMQNTAGKNFSA